MFVAIDVRYLECLSCEDKVEGVPQSTTKVIYYSFTAVRRGRDYSTAESNTYKAALLFRVVSVFSFMKIYTPGPSSTVDS